VKYTILAALFLLVCVGVGLRSGPRAASVWLTGGLAAAMVAVQFVVLTSP
jgi:hypothetical protein